MPYTVPNQKTIIINKPPVTSNFLQISNDEWMQANRKLTPFGLQLYLYLASNANGFHLSLSPEHADEAAGIKRTTFYKYMSRLEEEGYLVWRKGNTFDFYTSPRPENERSDPDSHSEYMFFEDNSPQESRSLQEEQIIPHDNREINNTNIKTDNNTSDFNPYPIGKVVEVTISPPVSRNKYRNKVEPPKKPFSFFDDYCAKDEPEEFIF